MRYRLTMLSICWSVIAHGKAIEWLDLLQVVPSAESIDYIEHKKPFHLHSLLTEQRHPKTWDLSVLIQQDTKKGLEALLSVDEDITLQCTGGYNVALLEQAAQAIEQAILEGRNIYLYGCGATGRLAKQVESCLWRAFWNKMELHPAWGKLKDIFPDIANRLIGEMTGADRALISSLEGFEDLPLIGQIQLEEHGIRKGDVVFAITEGGETSSVIGAILAAAKPYEEEGDIACGKSPKNLYFVYNNPDESLRVLERSRLVLDHPAITKVCLATGPQAVTGSTRMQAATSETFVIGVILEHAIFNLLSKQLSQEELISLGWKEKSIQERLNSFSPLQRAVAQISETLSCLTDLEAATYTSHHFTTYIAKKGMIPVFIDSTERAPTFRLFPLDSIAAQERRSWIQVWTPAETLEEAWQNFLGRPFKGLSAATYEIPFSLEIEDPFLKQTALRSLKNAGDEQMVLYDFSMSKDNVTQRGPKQGDMGVFIMMEEEVSECSAFEPSLKLFAQEEAEIGVILVSNNPISQDSPSMQTIKSIAPHARILPVVVGCESDPLSLRVQVALKMVLNAHSTGVMAKLGRVVGNTMTSVNPSNLKLIGRASYLIQSHVNRYLPEEARLSYEEANALLFDAIEHAKARGVVGVRSEVALCVIRVLEAFKTKEYVSWAQVEGYLDQVGLAGYLWREHSH